MVKYLPHLRILRINGCYGMGLAWLRPLQDLEYLQELAFMNDTEFDCNDIIHIYDESVVADIDDDWQGNAADNDDEDIDQFDDFEPAAEEEEEGTFMKYRKTDYLGEFLVARASTLTRLSFEGSDVLGFKLFVACEPPPLSPTTEDAAEAGKVGLSMVVDRPCPPILGLKYVNFSKAGIDRAALVIEPLLRQCPDLEILDVSNCLESSWSRFQWSILSHACLKLSTLNFGGFGEIDNDQLILVIQACHGLRSLIAYQTNIEDKVLEAIVDKWIGGQGGGGGDIHLSPRAQPFLELDVSWCTNLKQGSIERVVQTISTLKSIKFSWCQYIEMSVFQRPWGCLNLEELEAQGLDQSPGHKSNEECIEVSIFRQVSKLKRLRRLVIGSDVMLVVRDKGFGLLLESEEREQQQEEEEQQQQQQQQQVGLLGLEYLDFVGHEDFPLGESEVEVIATAFPKLKHFHYGVGLVPGEMRELLTKMRPEIQQKEERVYF
ncbi:hypothetical protein BGZ65_009383 [Modicella reniformis]|uniref:Uncharacterized protein n=1 Tax=Modicella reniformis TaxID=1440133 RepID=A0A9P6SVN4_9FUNG|nr:hypothetical protein BGZ65_009383 [Modicella reniformis]